MSPSAQVRGPGVPWAALRMQDATTLLCLGCWGNRCVGCAGRPGPGRGLAAADPRPSHLNTHILWSLALAQPLLPRWSWVLMRALPSPPSSCEWSLRASGPAEGLAFQKAAGAGAVLARALVLACVCPLLSCLTSRASELRDRT